MPLAPTKKLVRLSDVIEQRLEWLWPNRIALGTSTLLDGDPDQGKSLITLDLAARLSTGRPLPDGYVPPEPCSVVLLGREDGLADTVVPRLRAAGADLSRIHRLEARFDSAGVEMRISFPRDCELLRETIIETQARLVVIDPFTAFLDDAVSCLNEQMARRALEPVVQLAKETGAVIQLVRHLTKSGNPRAALHRGGGAVGIIGLARSAFLVGQDPEQSGARLLAATKCNLGEPAPTLAYRVQAGAAGLPVIEWLGGSPLTANDLVLSDGRRYGGSVERAMVFLQEALHGATRPLSVLRDEARSLGISWGTLDRARKRLGIEAAQYREDGRNVWYWGLTGEEAAEAERARFINAVWDAGASKSA
jgi:hypothetical protein